MSNLAWYQCERYQWRIYIVFAGKRGLRNACSSVARTSFLQEDESSVLCTLYLLESVVWRECVLLPRPRFLPGGRVDGI